MDGLLFTSGEVGEVLMHTLSPNDPVTFHLGNAIGLMEGAIGLTTLPL